MRTPKSGCLLCQCAVRYEHWLPEVFAPRVSGICIGWPAEGHLLQASLRRPILVGPFRESSRQRRVPRLSAAPRPFPMGLGAGCSRLRDPFASRSRPGDARTLVHTRIPKERRKLVPPGSEQGHASAMSLPGGSRRPSARRPSRRRCGQDRFCRGPPASSAHSLEQRDCAHLEPRERLPAECRATPGPGCRRPPPLSHRWRTGESSKRATRLPVPQRASAA